MKWRTSWRRKNRITMWSGWWCRKSAGKSIYAEKSFHMEDPVSIYGVPRLVEATAPVIRRIIQGNGFLKRSGWGNCCVWWSRCLWSFPAQEGRWMPWFWNDWISDWRRRKNGRRFRIKVRKSISHWRTMTLLPACLPGMDSLFMPGGCWRRSKPGMKILY